MVQKIIGNLELVRLERERERKRERGSRSRQNKLGEPNWERGEKMGQNMMIRAPSPLREGNWGWSFCVAYI